jgi:hypothetical protein
MSCTAVRAIWTYLALGRSSSTRTVTSGRGSSTGTATSGRGSSAETVTAAPEYGLYGGGLSDILGGEERGRSEWERVQQPGAVRSGLV